MIHSFNLKNKIVIITGGYGYLGKAITESLLHHGATVYVLGRSQKKYIDKLSDSKYYTSNVEFINCDVSNSVSISKAFKYIYKDNKKIDVLINNAFYTKGQSPEKMLDEEWAIGVDGVLNSVFKCIREIIPYYKKAKSGKIINISSMYGLVSPDFSVYDNFPDYINPPNYGAAKAGIIQLTKYYASYLGKLGINVNVVTPGPFPDKNIQKNKKFIKELRKRTCLNRIGQPEEVAGAFVFLASDSSSFITGQNIIVDGGWTTK